MKWPDSRLPAAMVGLGAGNGFLSPLPMGQLANLWSEPPYAVVGLGIGTLASHAKPYQYVRFYEIDPAVVKLSLPGKGISPLFTYLQDAIDRQADLKVILGDGRLSLEKAPDHFYQVMVIDAFSSDAIPIHLLTEEAIQLYLKKLAPGGRLIFNITNRYVDLRPVLADLADKLDLEAYAFGDYDDNYIPDKFGSDWMVLQRIADSTAGYQSLSQRLNFKKLHLGHIPPETTVDQLREHFSDYGKVVDVKIIPVFETGRPGCLVQVEMGKTEEVRKATEKKVYQEFNGQQIVVLAWREPRRLGGPVWTDAYSNLVRVLSLRN
jgi:hypothetical protein